MNTFTAVYQQDGDWVIAYIEELPGANSQGRTLEEARKNLREAVELILLCNQRSASFPVRINNPVKNSAGTWALLDQTSWTRISQEAR